MAEADQSLSGRNSIRAAYAPLVVYSFLAAGDAVLWRRAGVGVPDHPAAAGTVPAVCIAAGIPYFLRLPLSNWGGRVR